MPQNQAALCPQAFDRLFDSCDRQKLLNEIKRQRKKTYTFLVAGGFQLTPSNLPTHKKRLRQKLPFLGDEPLLIPQIAADGKGPWHTLHKLLLELPTEQVIGLWRSLLQAAREPQVVILALFLFPHDSPLHRLATRLLKCPQAWEDSHTTDHSQKTLDLQALAQVFTPPQNTEAAQGNDAGQEAMQQQLQAEIRKFKNEQELTDAKAHKKRKAELSQTKRDLQQANNTIQELTKQLEDNKKLAQQQLEDLKQQLEHDYRESHEQFLRQTLQVDHRLQIDAEQAQNTTDRLLQRIQDATFQQRTLNRNHGSKHALRQQKRQLETALQELQMAADDSFVTVRDLKTIIAQTAKHIADIDMKLTGQNDLSTTFSILETHIQSIPVDHNAEKRFNDTEDFIQEAVNHEILQEQEADRLMEILTRKRKLLHNFNLKPLEQALDSLKTDSQDRGPREIWYLAHQLSKLNRVTLIFDGYNAMIRNQIWTDMAETKCFAVARQHFVDKIKSKANLFQRIEIIFDGNSTTDTVDPVDKNVKIVYAAKKCEAHNADDYIVRRATELTQAQQADLIWIVTNDYGLRTRLAKVCDAYVETSTIPDFFLA